MSNSKIKDIYKMTPMQQGMFFYSMLDNEKTNYYCNQEIFKISGTVNQEIFEKCFMYLVDYHDIFRTIFRFENGQKPLQIVLNKCNFKINFYDISDEADKEKYFNEKMEEDFNRGFDLTREVAIRISLYKMSEDGYNIVWTYHHIILDGWSVGIIYKDLMNIYSMLLQGEKVALPKGQDYKKYIEWLDKKNQKQGLAYWNEYLKGYDNSNLFDANKKIEIEKEYKLETYEFELGHERTNNLVEVARKRKVTVNTLMQVIWGILLQKCNNTSDVVYGTVTSGRTHEIEEIEDVAGLFINTIPVRVTAKTNDKFSDLLHRTNMEIIKSKGYEYLPLADIQAQSISKNNLINHIIVYENFLIQDQLNKNNEMPFNVEVKSRQSMTNYDLNFIIYPSDIYNCKFRFNANAYEREFVKSLSKIFIEILDQITWDSDIRIDDIELLSDNEKNKLLDEFNDTAAEYPQKTIYQLFEEQVQRTPRNVAVKCGVEEITYEDLNKKANSLARMLIEKDIKPDDIIGIIIERSIDMIIGILAILKAGGSYLPIDPNYPEDRINYMIEDSGAKIILSTKDICNKIKYCEDIIDMNNENNYKNNDENLGQASCNDNLAYIIYTSGTTGKPKGVMIEHKNLVRLMFNSRFQFQFSEKDVWSMFHSYCFDFSVWEMYGALLYGGKLIVIPKDIAINTSEFLNVLKKERVTVLNQIPTAFYNLMNIELSNETNDLNLRYIIFGGEALKPEMLHSWKKKYPKVKLINMYGITETTVHVTYKEILQKEIEVHISNIGKPNPTLTTYIMDDNLKLKPIGLVGEICVGGDGVSRGYVNNENLTAEKFVNNPYKNGEIIYKSGDLGRWLSDGNIEYLGRKDHQVKIRGFRIELGEIENALLTVDGVKEAVVIDRIDNGEKYLCAYYVSDNELSLDDTRKRLLTKIPEYMVPVFFIRINNMPQTHNGKLDSKSLPNPYEIVNTKQNNEEALSEVETKIIKIWEDTLMIDSIGLNDNFFMLGGDSIKAIRLITTINKCFKTDIKIFSLYKNPTVRQMSTYLKDNINNLTDEDMKKVERDMDSLKENILNDEIQVAKLPKDYEDFYPMSDIELGMVYHSLKNPKEEIYHDQFIYEVEDLDEDITKKSLEILVKKHPILRTSFNLYDFIVPIQIIHKDISLNIEKINIDCKSELERNEYIKDYMKKDRKIPFNIGEAPIWRFKIMEFSDGKKYIGFFVHHAILDGWSVATFITELADTYNKIKQNNFKIDSLKCNYKQSVIEQQAIKNNKEVIAYWEKELLDYESKSLTFETTNNEIEVFNEINYLVDEKQYLELKNVSKKYGIPIKTICFAAYAYMINMMSQDNDIVVGLVGNTRPISEDGDKILGCFLNTIPIRIKIGKEMTWEDFLRAIDNKIIDITRYGRMPLLEIIKIANKRSDGERNILFDTLFNFVDFYVYNKVNFENNKILCSYDKSNTGLDFMLSNTNNGLNASIRCNEKFSKVHIAKLMNYFVNTLNMFIRNINEVIDKKKVLGLEEKNKILNEFNNTVCEYKNYKYIDELFEEQVRKSPNNVAIVCGEKEITYEELNKLSNQLTLTLNNIGIKSGDIVGVMVNRSIEMVIGIMAIIKSGAAYLPIDPEYPAERIMYMLEDSRVKVLITEKEYEKKLNYHGDVIDVYKEESYSKEFCGIVKEKNPNRLAYVIYTSGTTGKPKGVMIGHKQVLNFIDGVVKKTHIDNYNTILCVTTISFDICVLETLLPLAKGMKIILTKQYEDINGQKIGELIQKNNVEIIQSTPSRIKLLMENDNFVKSINKLKLMLIGGDAMPTSLIESLECWENIKVFNMYGPTETTVWSTVKEVTNKNEINIGKPIQNTKIFILDNHMNLQPIGVFGELYISGEGVSNGYLNNEELTKEKFVYNPYKKGEIIYKTGDLARWLPNGDIEHLGRVDHQVKIRGYRIEISEIENRLLNMDGINEVVVVSKERDDNKYLSAYYVGEVEYTPGELREFLKKDLPEYMIPSLFNKLEEIPLTYNGKVDRKAFPDENGNINTGIIYEAATNYLEMKLIDIWKEILSLELMGINENFFDLGGDSLKAMILVNKIYKEFNVNIEIRDIFETATIKNLANHIKKSNKSEYIKIKKSEKKPYYETSSPQKRMYVLQQLDLGSVAYNMPMSIEIEGDVSISKIEEVFKYLIDRHEVFRMEFKVIDGQIMQIINDTVDFKLDYLEIKDANHFEEVKGEFVKPFDLSTAPLLRVKLLKMEKSKYTLLIDMHHIISDAMSLLIMTKEFMKIYLGEELKSLDIQYKDYSLWQNKMKETSDYKLKETYWIEEFKDKVPSLKLPTDYEQLEVENYAGDNLSFYIGEDETKQLRELARCNETTIFMILISIFAILVSKYSGNDDIVIGIPILGRTHEDTEELIGVFANTLALRIKLKNDESFKENLKFVREKALKAYENQDYQYEELIQKVDLLRNKGKENLFNIMFIMENNTKQDNEINEIKVNSSEFISKTAKYALTLNAMENDKSISLTFNYSTNLYRKESIETIIKHYQNIVNEILNNDEILLNNISLLNGAEAKEKEEEIKKYIDDSIHDVEFNF